MNKAGYEDREIASYYAKQTDLQPPEESILRIVVGGLGEARMLDIGVGGGRTTLHFAKWTDSYVGIDYSAAMIAECRKRFAGYPAQMMFDEGDATRLDAYEDSTFDFILFSFNGIDYVSQEARLQVLRQVQRVGKPGASFCFSTHNLQAAPKLFSLRRQLTAHPVRLMRRLKKWFMLRFVHNRRETLRRLRDTGIAVFNDGAHESRFQTYYITPSAQVAQLKKWFHDIRVFGLADGRELKGEGELGRAEDSWLYFLCTVTKARA